MEEAVRCSLDDVFIGEPAFEHRGYMLDVSRNRIPTRDTIEWLIKILGSLRYTELQLYVEHSFTYTGHEVVWRDASPLTRADMAWIAGKAAENGMELVANMNGFGHMERWLKHERYRPMAECPDGAPALIGDGLMAPTCLAPTVENAAFAVGLAEEMLSAVGGSRIHIGCDEPFELGACRSGQAAAERGRDRIYIEHLNRIIGPLVADGVEVMFWGDLFRRDPSLFSLLTPGAAGVVWNYEAPSDRYWSDAIPAATLARLGIPDDANLGFGSHAHLFVENRVPFWVAPGTSSWNSFIGRNQNATANIDDAATYGSRHGARGLLLTDWGDNGHWQPLAVSLPSIVRAGVSSWTGSSCEVSVGPIIDELLKAPSGTGALIDELGSVGGSLGQQAVNASPAFAALLSTGLPVLGPPDGQAVDIALGQVGEARNRFLFDSPSNDRLAIIGSEMRAALRLTGLGLRSLSGEGLTDDEIDGALDEQRSAWLLSSRPGGLDDSLRLLRSPR